MRYLMRQTSQPQLVVDLYSFLFKPNKINQNFTTTGFLSFPASCFHDSNKRSPKFCRFSGFPWQTTDNFDMKTK